MIYVPASRWRTPIPTRNPVEVQGVITVREVWSQDSSLVLLVAFLARVFLDLFYGGTKENRAEGDSQNEGARLRSSFLLSNRFSIFHAGLVILTGAILFWLIPDFLLNVAKISMSAVKEFKWLLPGLFIFIPPLSLFQRIPPLQHRRVPQPRGCSRSKVPRQGWGQVLFTVLVTDCAWGLGPIRNRIHLGLCLVPM